MLGFIKQVIWPTIWLTATWLLQAVLAVKYRVRNDAGEHLMNDPGRRAGAATVDPRSDEAILERCSRGYKLVAIDLIDVV